MIIGPWVHHASDNARSGQLTYPDASRIVEAKAYTFFDRWLLGEGDGLAFDPPITYYQMGENQWRNSATWPPEGIEDRTFYLGQGGVLSATRPETESQPSSFRYDPTDPVPTAGGGRLALSQVGPWEQGELVESRSDVVIFTTPPLEEIVAVAGSVRVELFAASDRTDTDFTAILCDVYPDGRSMLVCEGIRRMRFRNSTATEEFMEPGKVYKTIVELQNTAITFLQGHCIRLILSSSNYPRYSPNPNTGGPLYAEQTPLVAVNSIYHDPQHPSALILPVEAARR
jgi:putative CocE/NonD family hydrolase